MSISDFIKTAKLAYYGCALELKDPFERAEVESKLNEMGIKYLKGYNHYFGLYSYDVIGTRGSKDKDLGELLEWFKGDGELKCFTVTNAIFRTKAYCFMRVKKK